LCHGQTIRPAWRTPWASGPPACGHAAETAWTRPPFADQQYLGFTDSDLERRAVRQVLDRSDIDPAPCHGVASLFIILQRIAMMTALAVHLREAVIFLGRLFTVFSGWDDGSNNRR
jgi:hypothetical protein